MMIEEEMGVGLNNLLFQIAQNTAGIPPAVGDGLNTLCYKICQNTAGTPPTVGDGLYNLFYKIAGNTAGIPPKPGDRLNDLLYKITQNTAGIFPKVGDSRANLLFKIAENTEGGVTDPDTKDFFARASITNAAQQDAVSNLVGSLKTANIWGKMRALYPFIGGVAASHSENLKASAYRMVWNGSITHSANGVTGGVNGFGSTGLNVNTTIAGSIAFGVYQRQSTGDTNRDIATLVADGPEYAIYLRYNDVFYGVGGTTGFVTAPMLDARGFFVLSRTAIDVYKGFKNGTQIGSVGPDPQTVPLPSSVFRVLLDANPHNLALAFISDGLSDADVAALNTAVAAYQSALGRNV